MVTYQLSKYIVSHMYIYIYRYVLRTYKVCNYYIINGNSPTKAMEEVDFMRFHGRGAYPMVTLMGIREIRLRCT